MHVSGVVFLTLLVNATTIYGLLGLLGMYCKRFVFLDILSEMYDGSFLNGPGMAVFYEI